MLFCPGTECTYFQFFCVARPPGSKRFKRARRMVPRHEAERIMKIDACGFVPTTQFELSNVQAAGLFRSEFPDHRNQPIPHHVCPMRRQLPRAMPPTMVKLPTTVAKSSNKSFATVSGSKTNGKRHANIPNHIYPGEKPKKIKRNPHGRSRSHALFFPRFGGRGSWPHL